MLSQYLQILLITFSMCSCALHSIAQIAASNTMERHTQIVFGNTQQKFSTHITYQQAITYQQNPNFADHSLRLQRPAFAKITNIKAYTQIANKKIMANVQQPQSASHNDHVFYDDTQEQQINFAQVTAGSQTVLQYEEEYDDPHLPLRLYLQDNYLMKNWSVVVNFPTTIEIDYQLINVQDSTIHFQKKTYPTYQQYIFSAKNIAALATNYPQTHCPQLIVYVKSIAKKPILGTVKNLYNWYYDISKKTLYRNSKTIQHLADSLTHTLTNDSLKAVKLLEWVQKKIRYIAFEESWGGFIPRTPEETYQKRYGDCKDMANLLATLARSIGLEAYFAWIGTRDLPYSYTTTPLPLADNHAIVVFKYNQKNYFVDATNAYTLFDLPTQYIQGKEALLCIDSINYEIVQVPIIEKEKNIQIDTLHLSIKNNQLLCSGKSVFTGLRAAQVKEQRKLQQQQWFQEFETQKPIEWTDSATSILANYQIILSNNLTKIGNDIYVPLLPCMPKKLLENFSQSLTTSYFSFSFIYKQFLTLELPPNYQIETIPLPQRYFQDNYTFSWHFELLTPNKLGVIAVILIDKPLNTYFNNKNIMLYEQVMSELSQQYAIIIQE